MKCIVLKPSHTQGFLCNFKNEGDISISFAKKWSWSPCSLHIYVCMELSTFSFLAIIIIQWNSCGVWLLKAVLFYMTKPNSSDILELMSILFNSTNIIQACCIVVVCTVSLVPTTKLFRSTLQAYLNFDLNTWLS